MRTSSPKPDLSRPMQEAISTCQALSARGNDLEQAIFDPSRAGHLLYALQHANAAAANASELAKKAKVLVPGLELMLIPNGIDTEHFKPLPRNNALAESLNLINGGKIREASCVIGFAGELREKKDYIHFLTPSRKSIRRIHPQC